MLHRHATDLSFLGGAALGILILAVFGFFAARERIVSHNDFTYVWAGARVALEGGDPFQTEPWLAVTRTYGTTRAYEDVFGYPPWVALGAIPLAVFPVVFASGIWTFGGMLLAAVAVRAALRSFVPELPAAHFLAALALFASQPGTATVWTGTWSFVLVAGAAASAVAIRERRTPLLLGAIALLGKPHLFAFTFPALARAANARLGLRGFLALAGALAAIVAAGWLIFPDWVEAWRIAFVAQRFAARPPTTLDTAFVDLVGPAGDFVAAAIVLALVVVGFRFDPRSDAFLAVWLAISATTPIYSWSYDHLVLIVPLIVASGVLARTSPRGGVLFAAVGFAFFLLAPILLYVVADARKNESFSIAIPLTITLLCMGTLWSSRVAREAPTRGRMESMAAPRLAL